MPPSTTVIGRFSISRPSAATNSAPPPRSTPSESQTISTSGVGVEEAAERRQRVGALDRMRLRLDLLEPHARGGRGLERDVARRLRQRNERDAAIVGLARARSGRRRCACAHPRCRRPGSRRRSGARAAPWRLAVSTGGFHSGPAAAMMTSAASVSRSSVSHHGVRRGVSSLGMMSNSSRVGGKSMRRGCGGMSRSSHHSTGRLSSPSSTSGCAKRERQAQDHACLPAMARRRSGGRRRRRPGGGAPMRACSASSSSVAGRSVRWMAKLQPSLSVSARISARWRATRALVVGLPGLGAAGRDRAAAFRLDELDAAGIREGLLGRIDDLHDVAVRAGRGELRERLAHLRDRAPEVRRSPRSRRAPTARRTAAGSAARSRHARSRSPSCRARCGCRSAASGPACRRARRPAPGPRRARRRSPACGRAWIPAPACEVNTMEGERSAQIHTVCAASHSCSRT